MAFLQFPNIQYFRVVETGEEAKLGYFNLSAGTELKHMLLTLFQRGVIVTPYDIRLNIYGNDTLIDPIITSDWATLSSTTLRVGNNTTGTAYSQNWIGTAYLDFQGNPLNPNINYYLTLEANGDYARNGETFYLGVNLDWYSPTNTALSATEAGGRFALLGKR